MTRQEIHERLDTLLAELPPDKAQLLLDFATFLKTQATAQSDLPLASAPAHIEEDAWDKAIVAAETYWFSLSLETRQAYKGQMVAVTPERILDSDPDRRTLRQRVMARYPDQPVLYIEAEAEPLEPVVVRSPRLR